MTDKLTRSEMFSRYGLANKVVDPEADAAYEYLEKKIWQDDLESSPHGKPWHTSFHASQFPGDNEKACARKAIYELHNVPEPKPIERKLRAMADAGKAIEEELIRRWESVGILLSAGIEDEFQTGFTDEEHWFTGNCDAIILPYKWNRPHVVEIKSKAQDKIDQMNTGQRGPDSAHRNQVLTYIAFAHELSDKLWPDLEPVRDGSIYYVSRDDPSQTAEFFFEYDPKFMEIGRARLKEWKELFLNEELPPRPKEWRWTEEPCKWCPFKRDVCKPDHKDKITKTSESHLIAQAKSIRPDYDYDKTRKAVEDRWKDG